MAQYGKQKYGTSYYGLTSARAGTYFSETYNIGANITNDIVISLDIDLPRATYYPGVSDFEGTWNYYRDISSGYVTRSYGSKFLFNGACRNISIGFIASPDSDQILISFKKNGVQQTNITATISHLSGVNSVDMGNVTGDYAEYEVTVSKVTDNDQPITIYDLQCDPCDISVEIYTDTSSVWTKLTGALVEGITTYTFDNQSLCNSAKYKFVLATSDTDLRPSINSYEINCVNANSYYTRGTMECTFVFDPVTFGSYDLISWIASGVTGDCKIHMQTQSSINGTDWTTLTSPYILGSNILRFTDGSTSGSICSQTLTTSNLTKWLTYKTADWNGTNNNNLYDREWDSTSVRYEFLTHNATSGLWENYFSGYQFKSSSSPSNIMVYNSDIKEAMKVKAVFSRDTANLPTPYVASVSTKATSDYVEEIGVTGHISVFNGFPDGVFTGIVTTSPLKELGFTIPEVCSQPMFKYKTSQEFAGKPFIQLYWNLDEYSATHTTTTYNEEQRLCVKCLADNIHNPISVQSGMMNVLYPITKKLDIVNRNFSPALDGTKSYKYYAIDGWYDSASNWVDENSLKNTLTNIAWSDIAAWNITGNVIWDAKYNALKCTGPCGITIKNALTVVATNLYNTRVKVLSDNGCTFTWGADLIDSEEVATYSKYTADSTVVPAGNWNFFESIGDLGFGPSCTALKVRGSILQGNEEVTYIGGIQFYNEDIGRIIDCFWEVDGSGAGFNYPPTGAKDRWPMMKSDLSSKLCLSVYQPSATTQIVISPELRVSNQTVNLNNIWENYSITIDPMYNSNLQLPILENYTISNDQPYYLMITNASKNGRGVKDLSVIRVNGTEETIGVDNEYPINVTYVETFRENVAITRGNGYLDILPDDKITSVVKVREVINDVDYYYTEEVDFTVTANTNFISWYPTGLRPSTGSTYYITYNYNVPTTSTIEIACDYTEPMINRSLWSSAWAVLRKGTISEDGVISLGAVNNGLDPSNVIDSDIPNIPKVNDEWDYSEFTKDFPDATEGEFNPDTLSYSIDSDNLWVKSTLYGDNTKGFHVTHSLRSKKPKENWYPKVHDGFYYIRDQRYYMYSKPNSIAMDGSSMPIIRDGSYVEGGGVLLNQTDSYIVYPRIQFPQKNGSILLKFSPDEDISNKIVYLLELYQDDHNKMTISLINGQYVYLCLVINGYGSGTSTAFNFVAGNTYVISYSWSISRNYVSMQGRHACAETGVISRPIYVRSFSPGYNYGSARTLPILDGTMMFPTATSYIIGNHKHQVGSGLSGTIYNFSASNEMVNLEGRALGMLNGENAFKEQIDNSFIAVSPVPVGKAPIILEKEDGSVLRKVSFTDPESGEFVTYNTEYVDWYGRVDDNGYAELFVSFDEIDIDNFYVIVYNDNSVIANSSTDISEVGGLEIIKNKVKLHLTSALLDSLINSTLKVVYTPKDAYTWDANSEYANTSIIRLSHHDGDPLNITYETGKDGYKILDHIELNPLMNFNNSGFLYVSNEVRKVKDFRINITPTNMFANGIDRAFITINPLDEFGNFTDYANLNVSLVNSSLMLPLGKIWEDTSAIIPGQHIYTYQAPLRSGDGFEQHIKVIIRVKDSISGICTDRSIQLIILPDVLDYGF